MSVTLIIPAASGATLPTAHGLRRPVWLATRPDGMLTLCSVLQELDLAQVKEVVVVVKQYHVDKYCNGNLSAVSASLSAAVPGARQVTILPLREDTADAVETITRAIDALSITGPIYVKDCDGSAPIQITAENTVAVLRVNSENNHTVYDLPSKSFVETCGSILSNIKEKMIVSDTICVGGYGFESAQMFKDAAASARAARKEHDSVCPQAAADDAGCRLFVSHVIFTMMLQFGVVFAARHVPTFQDWKTEAGWKAFCASYRSLMVFFEGTIAITVDPDDAVAELSTEVPLGQLLKPNQGVIARLRRDYQRGRSRVNVLTCRGESHRSRVEELLRQWNVPFDCLLTGQLHLGDTIVVEAETHLPG